MDTSRNPNLAVLEPPPAPDSAGWRRNLGRSRVDLSVPRTSEWWTGKPPEPGQCPGVTKSGKITSLPLPNLHTCSRQDVLDYFDNTWTLTEVLFSSLASDEAFYRPPYHGLRHPMLFYYVHPVALYINKLRVAGLIALPVNAYFESLFETGVDEMSWDDLSKNEIDWPLLDQLHEYRKEVYGLVRQLILTHPGLAEGHAPIGQDSALWALFMSFEHERIHLETSSVLIRELPAHLVKRPREWPDLHPSHASASQSASRPVEGTHYPANPFVRVSPGKVHLGKPNDFPTYGWDNEYGTKDLETTEFFVSQHLITNGEYWEFVAEGGYQERQYWTETGWSWRAFRNVKWPTFWCSDGPAGSHRYALRTGFEIIPMPWSWPVNVNYHEATAYCRWRAKKDGRRQPYRMPSEAEHQRLRQLMGIDNYRTDHLVVCEPYNTNLRWGSESPAGGIASMDIPAGTASGGSQRGSLRKKAGPSDSPAVTDLFGNVWQWCEDHFNPLPESSVHKYYDDFSTPCYDGLHQMIMGGSFVSTGDEATPWARFHFRPHFFQHAGFRMAYCADGSNNHAVNLTDSPSARHQYDTQELLNQYMTLHYGPADIQMPFGGGPLEAASFPQRCADILIERVSAMNLPRNRALDIGCAVGGAVFHLAKVFGEVIGVDLSEQFIETARHIQESGEAVVLVKEEGEIHTTHRLPVATASVPGITFRRADACSLPADFLDFDAVLLANVLCRLPSPMSCLGRLGGPRGIVRHGGLLLVTTPFSWSEEYTPKAVWLGGTMNGNIANSSEDGLKKALEPEFDLLERFEMPLLIREHRRKYQYIVTLATLWQRK